jgi:hypothetical protein
VRNSRKLKRSFTTCGSNGLRAKSSMANSTGTSRCSTITDTFWRTCASCSVRFWRSFGVHVSTLAKIPSSPPWSLISFAAVFSPTPGTPGRLSDGSPRIAAYSGYCAGVTPVRSLIPASS